MAGSRRLDQLVSYESIAKPGSRATAAIPIELPDRVPVTVTINSNNSIFELNTANNATSALLGDSPADPQRSGGDSSKTESIATDHSQLPGLGKSEPFGNRDLIGATRTKPGVARLGNRQMALNRPTEATQQPLDDVTPKRLDYGIEIISPNFEDIYSPSSLVPIRYRFSRPVAAGGTVVFTAVVGGEVVATVFIRNDNPPGPAGPHRQVQLELPGDIGVGGYIGLTSVVSAHHEASGTSGLSDTFRVISLHAEEIESLEEEIGDGGGFGGPGRPTLSFVNDLSEVHINTRDYGRNAAPLEWIYYGPLDAAPDRWRLELLEPSSSVIALSRPIISSAMMLSIRPLQQQGHCRHGDAVPYSHVATGTAATTCGSAEPAS